MNSFHYLFMVRIKIIVVSLFILTSQLVLSQNIGVLSAVGPVSGCELANNELVTIVIFNYGTAYTGSFDVSYQINGGSPVTESITLSPFPTTSTYTFTFSVPANLSAANSYNFKFYTHLVGDINPSNDTLSNVIIVSDALTNGGNVDFSQSICINGNSGVLNLTSSVGNTQFWQKSTTFGTSWNNLANTTNAQNYTNLTQETWYRAVIKNGYCPIDTSSIAILSIDSASIGGSILGGTTVCVPPNSGTLTLTAKRGTVLDWEFSANGGSSWSSLSDTTSTYNFVNQPSTYLYRALVQNGSCQLVYSDTAEVIVLNGAMGGIVSPTTQSVCTGINSGNITLSGHAGNILSWEKSTNNGGSWTPIVNTSTTQSFTNLTLETWYRAILSDCNFDTSSIAKILIETLPVGGTLTPDIAVCISSNTGIITLSGESGNIIDWEFSTNGGSLWSSLSNTSNSYNFNNLTVSTMYRVIVGNGSCSNVYSDTTFVSVDNLANAGTISAPTNVCILGNSGVLTSAGTSGTILDWESSINGGFSWTPIGNATNSNTFTNLIQTTLFHVIATNGVCPNDTSQYLITVDDSSNAGILYVSDSVCINSSGFNYLSGYIGNITGWETSTNNGLTWNSIAITSDTINYAVTNSPISYRTFVKNGTCPTDTSNNITIDVFPFNITTSNDTIINLGDSASISASGGLFYSWTPSSSLVSPNNASTIAIPTNNTNYIVSIIDTHGCIFSDSVLVKVIIPIIEDTLATISDIVIADLITANGDGYNDTWNIMGIENYPDSKVKVFNTSGNLIYESSNYTNDWKGTWQGNQLPVGTYYYIVEISGETAIRKGFITIVSQ